MSMESISKPIDTTIVSDNSFEKADKNSSRFRNIQLTIFLSGLSVFAQLYLFQPLLPTVAKDFKTSIGDSSLLVSSSTLGMALGLFFFAFKSDSFSRKNQMLFALLSSSLLTIASAWIESLVLLILMGIVKGFVIAGVSAVALAYLTEEVKVSFIGLAISMYLNGNTIGGMSGRIVATILDVEIGWRYTVMIIDKFDFSIDILEVFSRLTFSSTSKNRFHSEIETDEKFCFRCLCFTDVFYSIFSNGNFCEYLQLSHFPFRIATIFNESFFHCIYFSDVHFGCCGNYNCGKTF